MAVLQMAADARSAAAARSEGAAWPPGHGRGAKTEGAPPRTKQGSGGDGGRAAAQPASASQPDDSRMLTPARRWLNRPARPDRPAVPAGVLDSPLDSPAFPQAQREAWSHGSGHAQNQAQREATAQLEAAQALSEATIGAQAKAAAKKIGAEWTAQVLESAAASAELTELTKQLVKPGTGHAQPESGSGSKARSPPKMKISRPVMTRTKR